MEQYLGNDLLRAHIATHGLTRREFADLVGVTAARISQLCGDDSPSLQLAVKIATATKGSVPVTSWVMARSEV